MFCIGAFALVPFATTFPLAIVLLVLFGIGLSVENAAFPELASDVAPGGPPRDRAWASSPGLDSLAGFVMPRITTGVLGAFGVPPVAAIMLALVVTALAVGLVQARRAARRQPRPGSLRRLTPLNSARCPPDYRKRLISRFARKARLCPRCSAGCRCKGFAFVKRLLVASAFVASLAAASTSAAHASSTRTAGAQIQWTSAATAAMTIVTQYSVAGAQGNAVPTLLPSLAGVCTAAGAEANFTLTYGALSPRPNAATACLYKNALAVSVNTNDAAGFTVNQYLDAIPTSGVGVCAYPNGGASFPLAPVIAPLPASGRSGNPAAGTFTGNNLTSCAAGGSIVPAGTGGLSSGGATPGNPGTVGLEFYSPSGTSLGLMTMAGPTLSGGAIVNMYAAEDVQVNMVAGAPSTLAAQTGAYITLAAHSELIPRMMRAAGIAACAASAGGATSFASPRTSASRRCRARSTCAARPSTTANRSRPRKRRRR